MFVFTPLWCQTGGVYNPSWLIPPIWHPVIFSILLCGAGFPLSPCTSHALHLWWPSVMCDVTSGFCPLLTVFCLLTSTMQLCSVLACCQWRPHDWKPAALLPVLPPNRQSLSLSSSTSSSSLLPLSFYIMCWISLYLLKRGRTHR